MTNFPDVVAKIANDYLDRLKSQLRQFPAPEREDFLREIQSHLFEAYQQTPGDDDVTRIFAVLRNLGEPAEVVTDRLPGAMVRSGTKRNLPLYVLGGILIALFGIPLGFGGVAVLAGVLVTLAGILVAYYAATGSILLVGVLVMLTGLVRIFLPGVFDKLVDLGFIQVGGPLAQFFDPMPSADQGIVMIIFASGFAATGWGMLRLGGYLIRGLRFLFSLAFEWLRQFAQNVRRRVLQDKGQRPGLPHTPHKPVAFPSA